MPVLPDFPFPCPRVLPALRARCAAAVLAAFTLGAAAAGPATRTAQAAPAAPAASPVTAPVTAPDTALRVRPGLWESQLSIQTGDPFVDALLSDAQARVAALPPDQRQNLERMMAARGLALGAQPNTLRACISAEQAARDELPQAIGPCRSLQTVRSGNTLRVRFECTLEPPLRGDGEVTLQSATAYSGQSRVDTVVMGQPRQVQLRSAGRWLADDCGTTAPR